jgi:glycosyltransferase involved in cell wall biosynthesis
MASGLPVVGSDVGDVRAMLAEENRDLVVPAGDEKALAAAMQHLAGAESTREDLGRKNRARAESEYDADVCYGRYLELYRSLTR